ncbi:L,D-transpeptidase [Clostridium brassicae]|uniref:L,D-transpeptidase n=1 Tax=Clostridium brassicae TaxID=2999072 RepID=A0ABT4D527_9CLOT|nr:L,D-transpeptidase [Clostridium brassicae]MCY6957293.1 L,D-transpeptidase [Clostridium brassicae]
MYFNPYYSYMLRSSSYRATYTIAINTSTRKLTLFKNRILYKTYPVGVGKPSTPTPKGNFRIINKAMNPGGPFGARWMGLSVPGYGIHGTNNPTSIGKRVSNGCIRLYNANVIELYNLVPLGTPVKII